ncbi:copper chaperone PCu(A)C [Aliihoeflea aestuarii]|jgi:periplasmic copper chaperone A|uniref:copper chaperone PCu(A)C n=1 Tax=Aliihoeflea aestuarii TaxID=453840 RepID=UPI0020933AC9|nr:copper chaperone PCu(A)C [Aliihoeflea aestuarii]MCO6390207.1 copper chaperone PCu(A)C [Aliihoeflea aestuarii]
MSKVAFRIFAAMVGLAWLAAPAVAERDDCPETQMLHLSGCVDLDTVMAADLQLSGAWIGAMRPGEQATSAHLTILNRGETSDRLLGATSPAAGRIELKGDGPLDGGVAIEPGDRLDLRPGGLHLMLTVVDGRLIAGNEVEVTLDFEKAGNVVIPFAVREPPFSAAAGH